MAQVMKVLMGPHRRQRNPSRNQADPSPQRKVPSQQRLSARLRRSRSPPPGPVRLATGPVPQCPQPSGKQNLSAFIWSVADRLRGDYKQSDYGKVIVPFTVLPAQLRAGAQQHLDSE